MTDYQGPDNGAEFEDDEASLDERADTAVAVTLGRRGYVHQDGSYNPEPLVGVLFALIEKAEATKKFERASVCITRRAMMEKGFPDTPGREHWADQEDPELAEKVYRKLDGLCWRLTSTRPDGPIQSRFNTDHALVLVRTKVNPNGTDAVYVTRDLGCLIEDILKPQRAGQKKRADRDAALTAMLIERVSEHGKRFNRELVGGLTTALESAKAITAGALAAASVDESDTDSGDDE